MSKRLLFRTRCFGLALLTLFAPVLPARAQEDSLTRREQLLNGLNIVLLRRPGEPNFLLKLRIKSGAAFDLAGKEGMMALLSDALIPEAETREDIVKESGGRFDVTATYDAIEVTVGGRTADFERYIELLRDAIVNSGFSAEAVEKLRAARVQILRQTGASPVTMADRAIAARLFGTHPYGRPAAGTPEAVARVDRADLLLARERFLNANNATVVLASDLEERRVMRVLRQLLGSWRQSERIVPATFRQPGPFDARPLVIDLPGADATEIRLAVRGFAFGEKNAAAAELLAAVARERWEEALPEAKMAPHFVRHEAHALGGIFSFGATVPIASAGKALETARRVARSLVTSPPSAAEVSRAKVDVISRRHKEKSGVELELDRFLERDQYKLDPSFDPVRALDQLTPGDLAAAAARLFPDEHMAAVAVGSAAQVSPELARLGAIEVLGASATAGPGSPQTTPMTKRP